MVVVCDGKEVRMYFEVLECLLGYILINCKLDIGCMY